MNTRCLRWSFLACVFFFGVRDVRAAEQGGPARLLVVTVTKGFRHGSIETAEPVLEKLGREKGFSMLISSECLRIDHRNQGDLDEGKMSQTKNGRRLSRSSKNNKKFFKKLTSHGNKFCNRSSRSLFRPESLAQFDGVVFVSTTGELPIPDLGAFLKWIQDGHAFIGIHAARRHTEKFRCVC